jgi:hypothetical protein
MSIVVKGNRLQAGEELKPGEALLSTNKWYLLVLQPHDGNLVLYHLPINDGHHLQHHLDNSNQPLWATNTVKKPDEKAFSNRLAMQPHDGHLVLYGNHNDATWASRKYGSDKAGAYAMLQDDGSFTVCLPNGELIWSTQTNRYTHWMEKLPGHLTLGDVCVPGSHDAGMYTNYLGVGSNLAVTQQLSLYEQLRSGSRYFDLRPKYTSNIGCHIHHGMAIGPLLHTVLGDIGRFVREGTNETVLLEFSHFENMDDHQTKFVEPLLGSLPSGCLLTQAELNEARDRRLTAAGKPLDPQAEPASFDLKSLTLDELRGKVIVLIDNDKMYQTLAVEKKTQGIYPRKGLIYDSYSNKQDYESMLQDQAGKFENFGKPGGDNQPLFMLNWTLTPLDPDAYRKAGASEVMKKAGIIGGIVSKLVGDNLDKAAANLAALLYSEAVRTYANDINPRLHEAAESNAAGLFSRNAHQRMVNIINLDFVEDAHAVPLCHFMTMRNNP